MSGHDKAHQQPAVDPGQAEHVPGPPDQAWEEKAFRLSVARKFFCESKNTLEIAQELKVDEAAVYAVLDQARKEKISA